MFLIPRKRMTKESDLLLLFFPGRRALRGTAQTGVGDPGTSPHRP